MSDKPRPAAAGFIFITIVLDVLGIGLVIPVLPALVTEFAGGDAADAARWFGPLVSIFAASQFVFAPVLGALSDKYGRRPILLLGLLGYGISYVITGLAPSMLWLFVARLFSGGMGGTITTANAYLADISTPETRAKNFGLVGAAFGLGFVFGPALGGALGEISTRLPFFVAAGLVGVNLCYGFFVLPESLAPDKRRNVSLGGMNPLSAIAGLRRYPVVASLAVAYVFVNLAQRGLESVWVLHGTYRYGWGELANGLTLTAVGVVAAFNQGYLIRKVVPKLGERRVIRYGMLIWGLAFLGYGVAGESWMVFVFIPIGSLGGMAFPTLQGVVTGAVAEDEQGTVQGALTALLSLTSVFAPIISTYTFNAFTKNPDLPVVPGASFFLGAVFVYIAAFITWRTLDKFEGATAS